MDALTTPLLYSDLLRELLNAQNLQKVKDLIARQGGVKIPVRRDRYSERMRAKFYPVDKIDEEVRSLSEHMGWDITRSSAAG